MTVDRAAHMTGETRRKKAGEEGQGEGEHTDVSDIFKTNSYIHAPLSHARHTCKHSQREKEREDAYTHAPAEEYPTASRTPDAKTLLATRGRTRGGDRERGSRTFAGDRRD